MMEWNAQGIRLGYPIARSPQDSDLSTETETPDVTEVTFVLVRRFMLTIRDVEPNSFRQTAHQFSKKTFATRDQVFIALIENIIDRVETTGSTWLALTLNCCRCHDHKYDPISQKDYYSLFSFFQNIDEAGQISYKGFADSMPVPTMLLTTDEQDRQLDSLRAQAAAAEKTLATARTDASAAFTANSNGTGSILNSTSPFLIGRFGSIGTSVT